MKELQQKIIDFRDVGVTVTGKGYHWELGQVQFEHKKNHIFVENLIREV